MNDSRANEFILDVKSTTYSPIPISINYFCISNRNTNNINSVDKVADTTFFNWSRISPTNTTYNLGLFTSTEEIENGHRSCQYIYLK